MKQDQKNRFEVKIVKLESRHEEQSALTALLAIVGATASLGAQAAQGPDASPSCTLWEF